MGRLKVQLRGGFSDRMGLKPVNTQIQTNTLDERTRAALANVCYDAIRWYSNRVYDGYTHLKTVYAEIMRDVFVQDRVSPDNVNSTFVEKCIFDTIHLDEYDDVFTLIEYFAGKLGDNISAAFNVVFQKECVGYRFVNGKITPIVDDVEISEIESAVQSPYGEVNAHLSKALSFLSDRDSPDYENSVKESITAVERMCSIILGKQAVLSDALTKLQKSGVVIHPVLKVAFERLYNYTSDASGVRHAGQLGGKDTTFEEAKFMLVSCSAFVNYLKSVQGKIQ